VEEYRWIHLAGVETWIPVDREIDGVGRKQTKSAHADEIPRVPPHPAPRRPTELGSLVRRRRTDQRVGARVIRDFDDQRFHA
jgi:hypothetical protein